MWRSTFLPYYVLSCAGIKGDVWQYRDRHQYIFMYTGVNVSEVCYDNNEQMICYSYRRLLWLFMEGLKKTLVNSCSLQVDNANIRYWWWIYGRMDGPIDSRYTIRTFCSFECIRCVGHMNIRSWFNIVRKDIKSCLKGKDLTCYRKICKDSSGFYSGQNVYGKERYSLAHGNRLFAIMCTIVITADVKP